MRKFLFLFYCVVAWGSMHAQLLVVLQSPPAGLTYKPQLWNMILVNPGTQPLNLHIEVNLYTTNNAQQVLTGVTKTFTLPPGTTQLNANQVMPIQYNTTSTAFNIDPNPLGLLPLGEFEACYHFYKHAGDVVEQIAEQCQDLVIAPLSPPQLIYPFDAAAIEELHPQLSWLPPVPTQLFTTLTYDLTLVEMNASQSAADALQQNIPLYQANNISANSILYPVSAPSLQLNHQYAWRITAKNNSAVVGTSDTWWFTPKQFSGIANPSHAAAYVTLKKSPENAYTIVPGLLKFSYNNETADTTWNIKIIDLSSVQRSELQFHPANTPLQAGTNLVSADLSGNAFFIHQHIYQIEVANSRNEIWRLRFEYRNPITNN